MKKRFISLFLVLCMVLGMIPAQVFAAADPNVEELRFYSDCTVDEYTVISQGEDHNLTFNLSDNPYKFEVKFYNPEEMGYVFITSNTPDETKVLEAVYNEDTGLFETSGYFDPEDPNYVPRNVRVEYTRKTSAPAVGSSVDWSSMVQQMDGDLQNATVTNETAGGSNMGKVEFAGELADIAIDYALKEVQPDEIGMLRDYYKTQAGIAAYIVPGLDDSKYYAYLDMSDPNTYRMFLDDGLNVGSKAVELKMDFLDVGTGEYAQMMDISSKLSTASTIVGVLGDTYNIVKDSQMLREEVNSTNLGADEKQIALDAIDALEEDRIAFALLITAIPIIATGGAAGPAAAAIFTGIIGVMSAASDTIYEMRIGATKGAMVNGKWNSNLHNGELATGINWVFDYDKRILTISGNGPIPEKITNDCWFYNSYNDDGTPKTKWFFDLRVNTVIIQEGITSIAYNAFYDFINLEEIYLPRSLEEICGDLPANDGFATQDLQIYYNGSIGEWEQIDGYDWLDFYGPDGYDTHRDNPNDSFKHRKSDHALHIAENSGYVGENLTWEVDEGSGTLYIYGSGNMAEYKFPSDNAGRQARDLMIPWRRSVEQIKKVVVGEGATSIASSTFREHPALEEISLPDTLQSIGDYAMNCTALKEVTVPESVSQMGSGIFSGCDSLEKAVVNAKVDDIGWSCFSGCDNLKSVILPDSLKYIGFAAFLGCVSLEKINLPAGVESIGINAFSNCDSLAEINLPEGLQRIEEEAFEGCISLTELKLPLTLEIIEQWAFADCTGLNSMVIPEGVTKVENNLFRNCTGLTSVTIPDSVTSLESHAFENCTGLTDITIPDSVTKIGSDVFSGCTGLETIYFKGNAPSIYIGAFGSVTATAYYPAENATWTDDVMQNYGGNLTWKPYADCSVGHSYEDTVTPPTCGTQGYTTHTCSVCGDSYVDSYVPATGLHAYDDHKDAECNVCGEKRTVIPGMIPVYRLYNPYTHEHLLTGGEVEKTALLAAGWSLDGVAWNAPESGAPVYRLYNPYDDWHTYTVDENEKAKMVAAGWTVDGAISCSAPAETGRPIYRLFNPYVKTNFHLFTASIEERDMLVAAGWLLEGVAWFALN